MKMALLALLAVGSAGAIGWLFCRRLLHQLIAPEDRAYFSPAIGLAVCGIVGYAAVRLRVPQFIVAFAVAAVAGAAVELWRSRRDSTAMTAENRRLLTFTLSVFLCLYGMQVCLYALFSRTFPAAHEVWSLFNLTGTPPPDQMFAWHQAMFVEQHREYPIDAFYADMDLYDRPHLGGWITLFFAKLFRLRLTEKAFVYPARALHFYHCFWWLLNNLYLLGVAPLMRRLCGFRGAILAVGMTALGGCFLLCNAGGWMKFSSAYPFLLAVLLFLEGSGPLLQAALCAMSYYIHGSVLPYLAGLGLLQLINLRHQFAVRRTSWRAVAFFTAAGALLVGSWFVVVRLVGSRQPLFYYYIYDAGLTEAQTRSVVDIAHDFYARFSSADLAWKPIQNLGKSLAPTVLFDFARAWFWMGTPARINDLGSAIFDAQRFSIECALGIVAAPFAVIGALRVLAQKHAGAVALTFYVIPTLFVALLYRKDWAFSLHVMALYHTLVLFLFVMAMRDAPTRRALLLFIGVGVEGAVCVLFANYRFVPVHGVTLGALTATQWPWLLAYLAFVAATIELTRRQLVRVSAEEQPLVPAAPQLSGATLQAAGRRIAIGVAIAALFLGAYAVYLRRFY